MRYPFRTSFAPGAPRPDLYELLVSHATRAAHPDWRASRFDVAIHYVCAMDVETTPEPVGEYGTLIPYPSPEKFLANLEDGDRILRNHRRMAHAAWVRAVNEDDNELAACAAWHCARLHCGKEI